ncbi:MAG TPA: hypothetical protein PLU37_07995 [Chitinophagaceae bacterium]|nr:hypothetical protein [Chitinophagaceae bacterium]MCB9056900.1 hypothetical protein [Chitinophagales bacterium]HPG11454.1 hypothetical protein [Chitinophagaceae bacterium]HRX94659.1 hypothetical protein [Chitinophagaceae bacterium]
MKNKLLLLNVLFFVLFIAGFTSCSKDKQLPIQNEETSLQFNQSEKLISTTDKYGSITGMVTPVYEKTTIMLVGGLKNYGPYYVDINTGAFKISKVAAGTYKMIISYPGASNPNDNTDSWQTFSMGVVVMGGENTDVGLIKL